MEPLIAFSQKLNSLNLQKIERKGIEANQEIIIDLNISQLKKGEDSDGRKFPEYANEDYYKTKGAQGLLFQAGKHYNFILEGNFTEGFILKFQGNNAIIDSTDNKKDRLVDLVSGWSIFGLQENSMKELNEYLFEFFEEQIQKQLSL